MIITNYGYVKISIVEFVRQQLKCRILYSLKLEVTLEELNVY